jgi:hypothetical protein
MIKWKWVLLLMSTTGTKGYKERADKKARMASGANPHVENAMHGHVNDSN